MTAAILERLNLQPKQKVMTGPCLECGKTVEYRINVSGKLYYFCGHVSEHGEWCHSHHRWGEAESERMILRAQGVPVQQPAKTKAAPVKVKREDGGIGFGSF